MAISSYPRRGQPIAPNALALFLQEQDNKTGRLLCDLDMSVWSNIDDDTGRVLSSQVVQAVARQLQLVIDLVGEESVVPSGLHPVVDDLELEIRTFNCLKTRGKSTDLAKLTIREALYLSGFGAKCLVDLLSSTEFFARHAAQSINVSKQLPLLCQITKCGNNLEYIVPCLPEAHLPAIPIEVALSDLRLGPRTLNALRKAGLDRDESILHRQTVQDLLAIRGFGQECLIDLSRAIEQAVCNGPIVNNSIDVADSMAEIIESAGVVPANLIDSTLPPLPHETSLDDLRLRFRTKRCLKKARDSPNVDWMATTTIAELLDIPGFGFTSLLDLLRCIGARRRQCAFSTPLVRSKLNSIQADLKKLEEVPYLESLHYCDPRFGRALQNVHRRATSAHELLHLEKDICTFGFTEQLSSFIAEVETALQRTVEAEVLSILVPKNVSKANLELCRNSQLVREYYGFSGCTPSTLEQVGLRHGVSRERVRQICAPSRFKRLPHPPFAPRLDAALAYIRAQKHRRCADVASELVERGLMEANTTLASLLVVGQFFKREIPVKLVGAGDAMVVCDRSVDGSVDIVFGIARGLIGRYGAATIQDVRERLSGRKRNEMSAEVVIALLSAEPTFRWLDQQSGWFWFSGAEWNNLKRRIRKVLSVCESISTTELRAALRRDHRLEGRIPPKRVLLELCRQLDECSVHDDVIASSTKLDFEELTKGEERRVIRLFRQHGSICRREDIQTAALAEGVGLASFWRCISFCPTITRYGRGVYGLTGAILETGQIEAMQTPIRRGEVLKDHGWTDNGEIWIGYRLSESSLETGVISIPAAKREFLSGDYVWEINGRAGTLKVNESSAWGIGTGVRMLDAEPGDFLILRFNVQERSASIAIGDESLLEAYQEAGMATSPV